MHQAEGGDDQLSLNSHPAGRQLVTVRTPGSWSSLQGVKSVQICFSRACARRPPACVWFLVLMPRTWVTPVSFHFFVGYQDIAMQTAEKSSKAMFMKVLRAWKMIGPCLELVEVATKPTTFGPRLLLLLPFLVLEPESPSPQPLHRVTQRMLLWARIGKISIIISHMMWGSFSFILLQF